MNSMIAAMIGAILCTAALAASAQSAPAPQLARLGNPLRTIPAAAVRGQMQPPWQGQTSIDGKELHLAPGVQIRDRHNRIILSDSVRQPVLVKYLTDANGQLFRVWVLTAEEAAGP